MIESVIRVDKPWTSCDFKRLFWE